MFKWLKNLFGSSEKPEQPAENAPEQPATDQNVPEENTADQGAEEKVE